MMAFVQTAYLWRILLLLVLLPASVYSGPGCPFGWLAGPGGRSCYLISTHTTRYKLAEAADKCRSYQGHLLVIDDKQEETWVLQQLQAITSAYDNVRIWWLGLRYENDAYQWVDSSPVNHTVIPWQGGGPGITQGPCVILKNQSAQSSSCTFWNNLLCERPVDLPLSCDVDNGWVLVGDSCLKTFNDKRTWEDAQSLCQLQESNLATLSTFNQHSEVWDSLRNTDPPATAWTGLHVGQQPGSQLGLIWQDGTTLDLSQHYWVDGQPGQLRLGTAMMVDGRVQRRLMAWSMQNTSTQHGYVCQKPQGVCESGWLTHQTRCFRIFDRPVVWTYANYVCHSIGAQLVRLSSPSDQYFIQRYLPEIKASGYDSFWIGITDSHDDSGIFQWTDGTQIGNASHWLSGTPPSDTVGSRDCGYINTNDAEGRWRMTSDCQQPRTFVCTIPVNTPVLPMPLTTTASGLCEAGWQHWNGQCFYFADYGLPWHNASDFCGMLGGHLAVIESQDDQGFLDGMINGADFWVGLSLTVSGTQRTWGWVDGSQLSTFLNWASGEPNERGDESCACVWGTRGDDLLGKWNDAPCSASIQFVCQKRSPSNSQSTTVPTTTTTTPVTYSAKCGADWEERPGSDLCYQLHDETLTYQAARAACLSYNGTLASITDHGEQNYLAGRAASLSDSMVWIGATDLMQEGGWHWEEGGPFSYLNWNPGEPNDQGGQENCAAMSTKTSRWFDLDCQLQMGFLCKKRADTYTTTPTPVTSTLPPGRYWSCPTGYIGYRYQCYQTHTTPKSWPDAQRSCRTDGAEMVSLADRQENDFLFSILPAAICSNVHARDEECEDWAEQGECDRNPVWMASNCQQACQQCGKVCHDSHNPHQCQRWAQLKECDNNPSWMHAHCARSCGICGDGESLTGTWLGLNERRLKGSFTWSDMTPVTFTNWHVSMPLRFPTSSCALITSVDSGTWVNSPCDGFAKYACKKPMTVVTATTLSPFRVGCPVNALGYNAFCYQTVATETTWQQAQDFCSRSHGHLATINSMSVQSFIASELDMTSADHYWIGLSDVTTAGTFRWVSGDPVLFDAWNSNHTGNEVSSCTAMQTRRPVGLWQSLNCTLHRPFVCQYPRRGFTTPTQLSSTPTPAPTTPPLCPLGWTGFADNCYKSFSATGDRKSWSGARDYCRGVGGDLASIHNSSLNDFFQNTLISSYLSYWIGLTDADTEGSYMWSDGSPVQYTKWFTGEPNNAGGDEDCGEYNGYTHHWNDNSCYLPRPFVCALPRGKPLVTTAFPPTSTPVPRCDGTQWLAYDGSCYYVSPKFGMDATKTWFQARRFCQQNGGDLASVQTAEVNSFLVKYLVSQEATTRQYWIGFNKLGGRSFGWTDGSPVVFTSWAHNEPNDAFGGQSCANLYSMSGKWNDDNCNDEFHFICKRSNSSVTSQPPVPTPLIQGGCPPRFFGVGNACYRVSGLTSSTAKNFTQALEACAAMNSSSLQPVHLASVTNHQQQAFLMTLLEGVSSSVYIGLTDQHTNNHFVWTDNQEVTVTYWAPHQPSETWAHYGTAKEDCVAVLTGQQSFGGWDDVYCGSRRGYVCQTRKDIRYKPESLYKCGTKEGSYHYRDSCYGIYKTAQTWQDAEATCARDGGHLVSLRDIHELAQVSVFVYDAVVIPSVWIGLSYQETYGDYAWVDGWPVALTQWGPSEPDLQRNGSCVTMENGIWNDTFCNELHPFVCKTSPSTPPPTTPPSPSRCADPTWHRRDDFCYLAVPQDKKSWPEAQYLCRKLGMDLLSLRDEAELHFVQTLVGAAMTTPGYGHNAQMTRIWLGLQRTLEGGFRWSDNSAADYFRWNSGEPNNMHEAEDCAELLVTSGLWNDVSCIASPLGDRGYVCKTPAIKPTTSPFTTTTTGATTTTAARGDPGSVTAVTKSPRPGSSSSSLSGFTRRPSARASSQPIVSNVTLTGGQIAGIVIGLLGLIVILAVIVFVFQRRRSQKSPNSSQTPAGFHNALYVRSHDREHVDLAANGSDSSSQDSNRLSIIQHADAGDC